MMKHIRVVSKRRPAAADSLETVSSILNLLSAAVSLFSQVSSLIGLAADGLAKEADAA